MKKAKCRRCSMEAMVAVSDKDGAEAMGFISAGLTASTSIECVYCGAKQPCRDYNEVWHATYEADLTRRLVGKALAEEREKVARLQEGRW